MGTFLVYMTMPEKEIRKEAKKVIKQLRAWFKKNPTRTDCDAELFYGRRVIIKPDTIAKQVNDLVEELVKSDKEKRKGSRKSTKLRPGRKTKRK